jgi:hypothetical protein
LAIAASVNALPQNLQIIPKMQVFYKIFLIEFTNFLHRFNILRCAIATGMSIFTKGELTCKLASLHALRCTLNPSRLAIAYFKTSVNRNGIAQ